MAIKPIRTTADLKAAKARLAALLVRGNDGTHDDEIEVLTALIEQFEDGYIRIDAPGPVAAIRYRMEERGLSPRQLEPFIGSRARVSEVLSGKRSLSLDMIRSLHEGLGIPYEALISRAANSHDVNQIPHATIKQLNKMGFSLDRGGIPFFLSSSLSTAAPATLLRKTRTQRAASKTDQAALLLWQAAVLQKSETIKTSAPFERSEFTAEALRRIGRLSTKSDAPVRAIAAVREAGIIVVIMPPLQGTFLDGAAMINQRGEPIVGLTLRYDRIDNFWFTLLHELSHISLHFDVLSETRVAFVDDMEIHSDDLREQEADALAQNSLIPAAILEQVRWDEQSTYDDLVAVATRARVPLAVVAGRWQRDHHNYKKFARLIDRTSVRDRLAAAGT